jgi:phenylalanyl-tRNA synthetase beta chain
LESLAEIPGDRNDLAEKLTAAGLECELETPAAVPETVVTGRILTCEKHPNADRLSVCTVDVGEETPREIVCGAPNAAAGAVVCAALPGTDLGDGLMVARRKLRGVFSDGMLCSAKELGVAEDADGILLLPPETPLGRPVGTVFSGEMVLVTEPPSNRGDTMSVRGVAREVCALSGGRLERPVPDVTAVDDPGEWSVEIEDPADCPRYAGRIVKGVVPGPSPTWMADRLAAAGVRPILNLVDVTNYVLLELGHPLHAFDLDKLTGRAIGVRRGEPGERLITLDGKDRATGPEVLLITDGAGGIAAGGIMGGEATMVSDSTTGIFLEGASFSPVRVRGGARAMRLVTDASARFERGVDPEGVAPALDRCVELLLALCPGARLVHGVDNYPAPRTGRDIGLRRRTLRRILGVEIPPKHVRRIFASLEIEVRDETEEGWEVTAPTFRPDLLAEEDLIEEVARIWGYDRIPERRQIHASANPVLERRVEDQRRARSVLLSLGLTEVVTPTMVDGAREERAVAGDDFFSAPVRIVNPLSQDRGHLRGSLAPSLLTVLAANRARSTSDLAIFEVGRAYGGDVTEGIEEGHRVGVLLAGRGASPGAVGSPKSCDFFDMKGLLEVYVEEYWGSSLRLEASAPAPLDPTGSAIIFVEGVRVGYCGEVGAEARRIWEIPPDLPVVIAEIDLDACLPRPRVEPTYAPLPRFPGVHRDLAFVVSNDVRHGELEAALREAGGDLLAEVDLFDVYEGAPLAEGEKSLAYTLVFRSTDRSLAGEEVDVRIADIVNLLGERHGAKIR